MGFFACRHLLKQQIDLNMIWQHLNQFGQLNSGEGSKCQNVLALPFKYFGIYFTADWCGACARYSSALKQSVKSIQQKHPHLFQMLTVQMDETQSNFGYSGWKLPRLKYEHANELAKMLGVLTLPTVLIFNRGGQIVSMRGFHEILTKKEDVIAHWDSLK